MTVAPRVHEDFDKGGKLIGIEVIDASEISDRKILVSEVVFR